MFFNQNITTKERISKMKIQLQDEQPFWAYLILKLQTKEDTKGKLPPYGGMGVNAKGEMFWRKKFVDGLSDDQLKFCLAHEVGHLIFNHLVRKGQRNPIAFNVATDIVLNDILGQNEFVPPKDILMPSNHKITVFGKLIKDTDKKSAEEVYDELPSKVFEMSDMLSEDFDGENKIPGFDVHEYGDGMSDKEIEKEAERWRDAVVNAAVHAKQRGKLPGGMETLLDNILNPKLNWKQILRRYITNSLPFDYSFSKPNRKIPGFILPGALKESVDIVVHVDTSGSISNDELKQFMGEIMGIAMSHRNLNMTLIEADSEIQQVIEVNSRNLSKLKNMTIKGRGGTAHKPLWEWITKNKPGCKLFVSLTDLYSDIESSDKPNYTVLWIVPSDHSKVSFGKILEV